MAKNVWFVFKILPCSTQAQIVFFRLKKIESCNYEGNDRRRIASILPHHPFGLALFENYLYYTDWFKFGKGIRKVNRFTGGDRHKIRPTLWSHMDIKVYHPLRQTNGKMSNIAPILPICGMVLFLGYLMYSVIT